LRAGWFEVRPDANHKRAAAAVERNPDASGDLLIGADRRSQGVVETRAPISRLHHHHLGAADAGRTPVAHLESVSPVVQDNGYLQYPRTADVDPFGVEVDKHRVSVVEDFDADVVVEKQTELTDEERTPRPRRLVAIRKMEGDPVGPGANRSFREDKPISLPLRCELE